MQTQFKIRFDTTDLRSLLIEQAVQNNAIPANVDPDTLQMRVSPVTGVTFVPADEASDDGEGGTGGETPSND